MYTYPSLLYGVRSVKEWGKQVSIIYNYPTYILTQVKCTNCTGQEVFGTHNWLEAGLVPITRKLVNSILEVLIVFFLHITVTKFEPVVF